MLELLSGLVYCLLVLLLVGELLREVAVLLLESFLRLVERDAVLSLRLEFRCFLAENALQLLVNT